MQVVVANLLETRKTTVILVTVNSEMRLDLSQSHVEKGIEIEEKIADELAARHKMFYQATVTIADQPIQ